MSEEHLHSEIINICKHKWGFAIESNIPDWVYEQAKKYVKNREDGTRIGDLLVQEEVFTRDEIESFIAKCRSGILLGEHICTELKHSNNTTQYTNVQKVLCSSKAEGILFVEVFPTDEIVPHPLLKESKLQKQLLTECADINAIPVLIAGQTDAVMFDNVDDAKEFRDSYPRQKISRSIIYKQFDEFKILVSSSKHITSYLEDSGEALAEEGNRQNIVTETSLMSAAEHKKLSRVWNTAIALKATDVHFEPSASEVDNYVHVRLRIHGDLVSFTNEFKVQYAEYELILGKIVKLSNASTTGGSRIAIPVSPDNITYVNSANKKTEFRLEILPKGHGEEGGRQQKEIVCRVFDSDEARISFETLNMNTGVVGLLKRLVKVKGILNLIIGTTGSGKSSTAAAMLEEYNEHHNQRNKVYSLENPVERLLRNVTQIQITEVATKEFKERDEDVYIGYLKSLVRADPDALFLGEIRDGATASFAGQMAASGHDLLSTFHATQPRRAINRIIDLFDKDSHRTTFLDSLGSIITQRLVKKLCSCSDKRKPTEEEIKDIKFNLEHIGADQDKYFKLLDDPELELAFHNYEGCSNCNHTGVTEVVPVNGILVVHEARRRKLLSKDEATYNSSFDEAEYVLEDELMKLILNKEVSPLEL